MIMTGIFEFCRYLGSIAYFGRKCCPANAKREERRGENYCELFSIPDYNDGVGYDNIKNAIIANLTEIGYTPNKALSRKALKYLSLEWNYAQEIKRQALTIEQSNKYAIRCYWAAEHVIKCTMELGAKQGFLSY